MIRSADGFENFQRTKAKLRQPFRSQPDHNARRTRRRGNLHVRRAGNFVQCGGYFIRLFVEHIKVVAENVHDDLRGFAGNRFADAVAEERHHLRLDAGKLRQHVADFILHFFLVLARRRFQFDMHLAAMRAPGVLAAFRAANLLLDAFDFGNFQQLRRNLRANPFHFRQRSSRCHRDADDKMSLAEIRQKFAAKKRQRRQRRHERNQRNSDNCLWAGADFFQRALVKRF